LKVELPKNLVLFGGRRSPFQKLVSPPKQFYKIVKRNSPKPIFSMI
jgi:hypothetical protein